MSALEQTVPEGYKQTEVGVIPIDWESPELGNFVQSLDAGVSVNSIDKPDAFSHGLHILKTSCVSNGYFFPREIKSIIPEDIVRAKTIVSKGSIIISRMNTPDLVGELGYIDKDYPNCFLPDRLWQMRFRANLATNTRWLAYILSFPAIAKKIKESATGTSNSMKNISKGSLLSVSFPAPSYEEQTAIANALSDVDALLTELEKLIAKKQAIKTTTMQQLLTGKTRLPLFATYSEGKKQGQPKGTKPSELGEIPEDWDFINIGNNAVLKARIGWQALTTKEYLDTGSKYLVTGTDFDAGEVNWNSCCFVSDWRYKQDTNIQLKENDVLITKDGTIGKVGFINELPLPATLNSGVFVVRPKAKSFYPKYLFYVLTSSIFKFFIKGITAGSTITHLYQKDFVYFEFPAPDVEEQTAIATILSDMDDEIQTIEQRLAKTRQIKQGMMQELLTGRTRLPISKEAV
ncbi:restriction endonuclease subunit S [Glaciecola sp. KUL10]|uniref:restriction endonuclease subunit S n=1 Tax=Glaciecola sp. (strain KUL10) TaxID=2161813 RepID=UPI000D78922C|nr:restriction endonuclease subunit S [Glaciecola sp. KUL10]GBL03176.1 hypothetical protein KUL10_04570 [Glaciecola sp. KUL10]